jgi:hypothetical protein
MLENLQIMNQNTKKLKKFIILSLFIVFALFTLSSCTKEVPKELLKSNEDNKKQFSEQQMPNDSIHKNLMKNNDQTDSKTEGDDKLAEELTKEADAADAKYEKSKSDADKKAAVEKQMEAANYLMFQADLPPKQKYRPALKRYRRVLELDPANKEAAANKKQIEDIYESMGMPIPN